MEKFTFLGKKVAMSAFLCCFSLVGFAQEDTQTFNFDATETQEYAAFFKQPSAIEGKCNAEVMGIDINREAILRSMEAPVDTALLAHKNDSLQQQATMEVPKKRWIPNSNKSVWLAMVLPGAGQIYNRKYWKLPIIYGGFVGCAYALTWNSQMYKDYSQAYQDIMSNNPSQDSYLDFLPPGYTVEDVNRQLEYFQSTFKRKKDAYRRQRDLSVFVFIGVYLLSVIDAYVDAELSDFDISKDLSMTFEPAVFNDVHRGYPEAIGIRCSIKF